MTKNHERRRGNAAAGAIKPALLAGLLLLCAAPARCAEERKGAMIRLEEEELSLTNADGTASTMLVSKSGAHKKALLEEVKDKLFRKLEVRSEGELKKKNLQGVYAEESGKMLKVKAMAEPRLGFYDADGKLVKSVPIGIAVNDYRNTGPDGRTASSFTSNIRHATVSNDGQYATLTEDRAVWRPIKDASGKVTFYGVDGNILWEKQYPKFRGVVGEISGSGLKAFMFEYYRKDLSPLPENEVEHQFGVYGRSGKRLIFYPKNPAQAGGREITGEYKASPSGRYVTVEMRDSGKQQQGWIFFDTDKRSSWFFGEKELSVTDISDAGLCALALSSGAGARTIDLKTKDFKKLN